jgi:hypothetical protein
VPYVPLPIEELRRINERFARGYELLNSIKEPVADIAELRRLHPGLMTFATWLERTGALEIKELLSGARGLLDAVAPTRINFGAPKNRIRMRQNR